MDTKHTLRSVIVTMVVAIAIYSAHRPLFLLASNVLASFSSYALRSDIAYGTADRNRLDVYAPSSNHDHVPVVIFIHGGSWQRGNKSQYRFVGAALAKQGYVAVLPNYQLYPNVRFPVFVQDIAAVVAWTRAHAREFGGDPAQIYLSGHSAGAHIAMLVALDKKYLAQVGGDTHWLRGVIGLAGPYDLIPYSIFGPPGNYDDARPTHFVRADAPPLLLLHGLNDHIDHAANARTLEGAITKAGGSVKTKYYDGVDHNEMVNEFSPIGWWAPPILEEINEFIFEQSNPVTAAPLSPR